MVPGRVADDIRRLRSTDLGDLFKWSARSWGIGALLSLPLFDGGRREAGVQNANAVWGQAAASYREQVRPARRQHCST